jgi:indole-3-glycerol phosphate synthase
MSELAGRAAHTSRRIERLKVEQPVAALRALPGYARVPRAFAPALSGITMDLRFAEPGRGLLVSGGEVTSEYAARRAVSAVGRGAAGLGVWTERNFHAGDYAHLDAVRAAVPEALVAMMDYVVDAWQLERARAGGADAILLIPELLGPFLERMTGSARDLGLTPIAWDDGGAPRLL